MSNVEEKLTEDSIEMDSWKQTLGITYTNLLTFPTCSVTFNEMFHGMLVNSHDSIGLMAGRKTFQLPCN